MVTGANPGVTLPVVTGAASCTANDAGNPLLTTGYYTNSSHYFMGSVTFRPAKRVTSQAGYSITSVDGKTPQFNALRPDGSLRYNYHQPLVNPRIDLGHNLAWNAGWNYYQYNEASLVGPTAARYFHANNPTLSLLWSF